MSCLQSNRTDWCTKFRSISSQFTLTQLGNKFPRFYSLKRCENWNFLWQKVSQWMTACSSSLHTKFSINLKLNVAGKFTDPTYKWWKLTLEAVGPCPVSNRQPFVCDLVLGLLPCHIFCLVNSVVALLLNTIVNLAHWHWPFITCF